MGNNSYEGIAQQARFQANEKTTKQTEKALTLAKSIGLTETQML